MELPTIVPLRRMALEVINMGQVSKHPVVAPLASVLNKDRVMSFPGVDL